MSSLLGLSQKGHYALRALFELALRYPQKSITTVSEIADTQKIPLRFLEQILAKLKSGGFLKSHRGSQGGYILALPPSNISVGQIISFIEGADESVDCIKSSGKKECALSNECVFKDLWQRARTAVSDIFDQTTFQDLVDSFQKRNDCLDYII